MGWIDGPALPAEDGNNVFDIRFRGSDGLWRGKPIESYPFVWIERDVQITNADVLEWLNRRVFLVVTGSWAEAEIFTSQRLAKPRKDATDDANELVVHAEPVGGDERSGARWCDITEHLLYPGSTQLSFRLKRDKNSTDNSPASAPSITIERWPTGCRVNTIQVHRASEPSSIQATFNLERPAGYMIVGMPAVRTIPLMLKVQLESIDSNKELANITKEIGPLADLKRTVTMNIPWMSQDGATPSRLRLRVQLTMTNGVVFDEPFPLEFRPGELESAGK
jgi:hypothetical protein